MCRTMGLRVGELASDQLALSPGLWDLDLANRIAMATNQLPRNGFEEMLLWTNQGKLWQYPINNEAGMYKGFSLVQAVGADGKGYASVSQTVGRTWCKTLHGRKALH